MVSFLWKNWWLHVCNSFALQDISAVASKCATSTCTPVNLEESTSSYKSRSLNVASQDAKDVRTSSTGDAVKHFNFNASGSKNYTGVTESLLHSHDASGLNMHACATEYGVSILFFQFTR